MTYDLAIIGSGASATYSLINILTLVSDRSSPLKVCVLSCDGVFNGGVAYGNQSGENSLTITKLGAFATASERASFTAWIIENRPDVYKKLLAKVKDDLEYSPGPVDKSLDSICVPRYLYGEFLNSRVSDAIQQAKSARTVEVTFITAEVMDIEKRAELVGFVLSCIDDSHQVFDIETKRVLCCLGGAPSRSMRSLVHQNGRLIEDTPQFVDAPYASNLDLAVDDALNPLSIKGDSSDARILLVGSNASSSEVIHLLARKSRLQGHAIDVTVCSGSGKLPVAKSIDDQAASMDYSALDEILNSTSAKSASQVYSTLVDFFAEASRDGVNIHRHAEQIFTRILGVVNTMQREERLRFLRLYACRLGEHFRGIETEYLESREQLSMAGRLKVIKKRPSRIELEKQQIFVEFDDGAVESFDCLFNCSGPEDVCEKSSSQLIKELLSKNLAFNIDGQAGFAVDNFFQSSPGLHIFGPLLAGNEVGDKSIWHMEHCGRIIEYSEYLASCIVSLTGSDSQDSTLKSNQG